MFAINDCLSEQLYRVQTIRKGADSEGVFKRRLTEIEVRQKRRLELLQQQQEHSSRLQSVKDEESVRRRIQAETDERKRLRARSRMYYEEYAQQWRAKKLAQKSIEERVSHRLFLAVVIFFSCFSCFGRGKK